MSAVNSVTQQLDDLEVNITEQEVPETAPMPIPVPIIQPQLMAAMTDTNLPMPIISPLGTLPRSPSQFPSFSEHMPDELQAELDIEEREREAARPRRGATNDIRNILGTMPLETLSIVANQPSSTAIVPPGMEQNDFEQALDERRAAQRQLPQIVRYKNGKPTMNRKAAERIYQVGEGEGANRLMGMARSDIKAWAAALPDLAPAAPAPEVELQDVKPDIDDDTVAIEEDAGMIPEK